MKWLLVVIVSGFPLETNLIFDSLESCLKAEYEMRSEWSRIYNRAIKQSLNKESLDLIANQISTGTCVPTR